MTIMETSLIDLNRRQFLWGLSNGLVVLALSGIFWFWLAAVARATAWGAGDKYPMAVDGAAAGRWLALIVVPAIALVAGAVSVRRKAQGFSRRDLRRPELSERARGIGRSFAWTSIAQGLGCSVVVGAAVHAHREDLIWPGLALVVSLHFLPLARSFRMRPYYATAVAGSIVAVLALGLPDAIVQPGGRLILVGTGMGLVVWMTAAYAILRAERLAAAWCRAAGA